MVHRYDEPRRVDADEGAFVDGCVYADVVGDNDSRLFVGFKCFGKCWHDGLAPFGDFAEVDPGEVASVERRFLREKKVEGRFVVGGGGRLLAKDVCLRELIKELGYEISD